MTKNALMPVFLSAAKALGLFAVARRLTRKHLRIIAYHGGNFVDENTFRGGLFITTETFKKRIDYLKRVGYPVLPLAEAIELLQAGKLPDNSTVITIDDGWYSCLRELAPILKENNFCSTLYMSSYYMNYPFPVFNVAVDYAIWKSKVDELNLSVLDEQQTGFVSFRTPADRMDAHSKLLRCPGCLRQRSSAMSC